MLLKKLTVYDLFDESSISFDFDAPKKTYRKKDIERLNTALSYAFFGESVLAHGKVELSFENDGNCLLVRDFKENTAFLQTNGKNMEKEEEINLYVQNLLGLDKSKWDNFFFIKESELYENSFENTGAYFSSVLSSLSIDKDQSEKAAERFKNRLSDYEKQDALLETIDASYDNQDLADRFAAASVEVTDLQQSYDRAEKEVYDAEKAQGLLEEYNKASEEYKVLLSKQKEIDALRGRLAVSKSVSDHIDSVKKSVSIIAENDELQPLLIEKQKELDEKVKETDAGERVLKKKQSAFSELTAEIQAHYVALSELIVKNTTSEADKRVIETVSERFADMDKKLGDLREKEKALSVQLREVEKDIAVYSKKYQNAHLIQSFDRLYNFNRTQLEKTAEKMSSITIENGVTAAEYIARYHDLEKKKDDLFRFFILADNLLKEVEAIDSKIGENNSAINSQQESLDALENAKETLTQYLEKCRKKVELADADILALRTQKKYFDEINALEYGEHCPVCNMPVIDKVDNTEALKKVEAQLAQENDAIASYRNVLTEYSEKLEAINLRIGSLRAKIDTSKGYVSSLQQSKLTKIALVENIFRQAGVNNKDELAALLERTVQEVAQVSVSANELSGLATSTFIAEENLSRIGAYVKEITGEEGDSPLTYSRQKLLALEEKNDLPAGTLSGQGEADGDVYALLQEALEKKKAIETELDTVRSDILACQGRGATISENGAEISYGQLCISYAGKVYASAIEEIRVKENKKQKLVSEIAALIGVLKSKREAIEQITEDVRMMENRFQNNLDYLETIRIADFDNPVYKDKSIAELEKDILSEGEADAIRHNIEEFDQALALFGARCATLGGLIGEDNKDTLNVKKAELAEIGRLLNEKKTVLAELNGIVSLKKVLAEKRAALSDEAKIYEENYSFLTHVFDDSAVIVKDTVNYALLKILPRYLAECKGSGLILKDGKKTLHSIDDEVYSVLLVALADSFRYIVSGILDCPGLIRMVALKANSVSDAVKVKLNDYAKAHNIILLYTK